MCLRTVAGTMLSSEAICPSSLFSANSSITSISCCVRFLSLDRCSSCTRAQAMAADSKSWPPYVRPHITSCTPSTKSDSEFLLTIPCAPALAAIDRYMFVEKAVMATMGIIEQCSRIIRHTVGPCMPSSDMSTRTISGLSLSDRQRDTASVPSVTDHMTAARGIRSSMISRNEAIDRASLSTMPTVNCRFTESVFSIRMPPYPHVTAAIIMSQ